MPGFDGTGPMGYGPMTGGGRGFCTHYGMPYESGYSRDPTHYVPGFGVGRGFGRGRGFGSRGFGRGFGPGMGGRGFRFRRFYPTWGW